jgi:hypothetical protein
MLPWDVTSKGFLPTNRGSGGQVAHILPPGCGLTYVLLPHSPSFTIHHSTSLTGLVAQLTGLVAQSVMFRGRGRGGRGGHSGSGRGDLHTGGGSGGGSGRARPTPYQRSVPPRGGNGKIRFNN